MPGVILQQVKQRIKFTVTRTRAKRSPSIRFCCREVKGTADPDTEDVLSDNLSELPLLLLAEVEVEVVWCDCCWTS
jgi:hypothetical protein